MYDEFYQLQAEPFRLSPDHRFCYDHKGYARARACMAGAFAQAEGIVMITGRPGTGKTTLIGELIESLAGDNVTTANLVSNQLGADDLLKMVANSFGLGGTAATKSELLQQLDVLLQKWHREERRALLIVDEAQDLSASAIEELRLLSNIHSNGKALLQIFLLGQPELRELMLSPALEQVHQRVVAASHLEPLKEDETEAYIIHRLEKVGWSGDPAFSKTVYPLVYKFSEGIPRRINLICSRLFLHGSSEDKHALGVADLREVIRELQSEQLAVGSFISNEDFAVQDEFDEIAPPPVNECAPVSEMPAAAVTEDEEPVDKTAAVPPPLEPVVAATATTATAVSKTSSRNRRRGWVPLAVIFILALIIFNGLVLAPAEMVPARWRDGVDDLSATGSSLSSDSMDKAAVLIVENIEPAAAEPDFQEVVALPPEAESTALAVATAEPVLLDIPEPAPPAFEQRLVLVEFAFDSSELSAEATLQLDEVASSVAGGPQQVNISGYTDSRGDPLYNQRLSGLRAAAVAAYLTESGIQPERLIVEGRGIYDEKIALPLQRDRVANIASQRCIEIVFDQEVLME